MGYIIFLVLLIVLIASNIKVVPQAQMYVVERLGSYSTTWETGIHVKIPFLDRIARKVSIKEQVIDFPPSSVITKDNVSIKVDSVTFFQVTDPKLFCYGIEKPIAGIEQLTATTLRNIFGNLELDESLTSRDTINSEITSVLDNATDKWGIKVNRVELKNIEPPRDILDAMEKQMRAERERRQIMLEAEGQKKSSVLISEGKKQSSILDAEAAKESAILRAEGVRQTKIREAQGEAEAIKLIKQAQAEGIKILNEARPSKEVLQIRGLEALEVLGNGKATKIIVPSELQSLAGMITSIKEIADGANKIDGVVLDKKETIESVHKPETIKDEIIEV